MKKLDKKYIQINICDFYRFLNDENMEEKVRDYFMNHHCCIYNKNNFFVFERFFSSDELDCEDYKEEIIEDEDDTIILEDCNGRYIYNSEKPILNDDQKNISLYTLLKLKEYLKENGYFPYNNYIEKREADDESIVPGYSGILIDLSW